MPTYEYHCRACQSDIEIWFRSFAAAASQTPICTVCGSKRLKRLISASAALRLGGPAPQSTAPAAGGSTPESPQELARVMQRAAAGRNMGEEFKEVAARLDKGETPQIIEKSLRKRKGQKSGPH
jgi:putative FmdB family regulatory protein